ncbi:Fe transport protein 3 [Venturia nashicola]|uniref:Fe transport protein 3 n=1 Tax=Venturia nashicola TaxID=86259 RepID=A0A4Z1PDT0_9PEZI|nr:Fe transport protein 3 [Venturia nashicola]
MVFKVNGAMNPGMNMNATAPAMVLPNVKPKCGTAGPPKVYDLPIHVAGLFLVLIFSCLGAGFPLAAKKFKGLRIPPRVFFFCKHFGTGVLIATAFVHLLPTAFESLNNPCLPNLFTDKYPAMPGVIGLGSMFMLFGIEMWMHSKMPHGHSHGGSTGEEFSGNLHHPLPLPPASKGNPQSGRAMGVHGGNPVWLDENKTAKELFPEMSFPEIEASSEMPMWFVEFYEQYVRQRSEMLQMIKPYAPSLPSYRVQESDHKKPHVEMTELSEAEEFDMVILEPGALDPMVLKKMSMEITLLEGGILFHSVFVGMTVSITTEGFIILLIAILFHQTFEGLGLGSRIAAVPYPKGSWKPWALVFAFGTTAPIGQAIGLITRNTYDPNSAFALILVGFFNAFSSGLLIYAGLVDLLHADFLSEEADRLLTNKKKMLAFSFVLMGAASMSIVGAFA